MSQLTVAIPIYNGARFLVPAIASLLAQTYRDFKLICLDDGSTDDSFAIASQFAAADARVELRTAAGNSSLAANWNRAMDVATTPFFVLAHQDDVYEPQFLEAMLRLISGKPRAFAAHAMSRTIDETGAFAEFPAGRFKERFWPPAEPVERDPEEEIAVLLRGNYVIAPSVIFRTAVTRAIGPFDHSLQFVTDWDYWFRGLMRGHTLVGTHQRLVRFRRHAWTATRASESTLRRYTEELELLTRVERERPSGSRHPFVAVENTITTELAARLASGHRDGALALLRFGRERVPRFAGSARERLLTAAVHLGTFGGKALRIAEEVYLRAGAWG